MTTTAPFQTLEEVDRYLAGNKIECLVCGRHFSLLNKHLSEKHSLTTFDYRVQFGIPFDRELASAPLRAQVQRKRVRYSKHDRQAALAMPREPFQTMADVDDYLSGSKIECLVCNKHYHCLTMQHLEKHGLSLDEYRVKFGIPYGRSLTSAALRDRFRANVTPELVERLLLEHAQYVDSRRGLPIIPRPPKPMAPAVTDLWRKQGRKGLLKTHAPVTTKCAVCGCDFVTTLSVSKRSIRCMNCAPTWSKTTRDNYWRKKLGAAYVPMHERKRPECEPFQTTEQVDEYLSGETVECLICGRRFNGLHMHLKFKHGITDDDYRQRFGIPLSRALNTAVSRAKAADKEATAACVNCGAEIVTSIHHASRGLLCLQCDNPVNRRGRETYWRYKGKTVPPPLSPAERAAFETPFHTPEALDAYLSGNTVACLICGRHMYSLPLHLHRAHNLAPDDYRHRFGIPLTRALIAAPLRAAFAAGSATPESLERFKRITAEMRSRGLHKATNPLGAKLVAPCNRWRRKKAA